MFDPEEAELARLSRIKQVDRGRPASFGATIVQVFKKEVTVQHRKFGNISEAWVELVPTDFIDHSELSAFSRGTLTVLVDNASHLYSLKQLLLAGLEDQLLLACKGAGLRKVNLKPGKSR